METRNINILRLTLAATDLVLLNLSFALGVSLSEKYGSGFDRSLYSQSVVACNLLWFVSAILFRLYSLSTILTQRSFSRSTWKSLGLQGLLFLPYLILTFNANVAGNFLIYSYAMLVFGFLMSRFTGGYLLQEYGNNKVDSKQQAVIGIGSRFQDSKNKAA